MEQTKHPIHRCAIYRKSSEEGLEQDFNSLHSQREDSLENAVSGPTHR